MTKPANFPARKAARQRSAAERRLPRLLEQVQKYPQSEQFAKELEALDRNNTMLVTPQRDVRTKKVRARAF